MTLETGDRIRVRRSELRLSQAFVAKSVGVSRAAVSQWELGAVQVLGKNLVKLAAVLKTTPQWLMGQRENEGQLEINPARLARALELLDQLPGKQLSNLSCQKRAKILAYLYASDIERFTSTDITNLLVLLD